MTIQTTRVTIIIATYNRAALLDECLYHLGRQRFAPGDEVIVVDNGSTDGTAAVVGRHQLRCAVPLRLLHESIPGKSHAITRALAVATGDILAFTDDDANVDEDWLDALRDAMADPVVALAGGPVRPRWQSTVPQWIRRARDRHPRLGAPIGLLDYGDRPIELGRRTVLGANLAVRREVFIRAGGFPAHLGKLRGTLLSGEDHELCRRVQDAGFRAIFLPGAAVQHWVPAERARASYCLRWFYWSGVTHAIMDGEGSATSGRALHGLPLYLFSRAAAASAAVLTTLLIGNRASALNHAIDVAFAIGYAAERWGLTPHAGQGSTNVTGQTA
jgi:GT2 family glycosyltransferase